SLPLVPKLSSGSVVKIRYNSIDVGTTRWKEGTFEVLEKDNKVNLCLKFNAGGALKSFQLNHNVKNVMMQSMHTMRRIVVSLKDGSVVTLERIPTAVCCFLVVLKTSQGSASFSVLGNRSVKNEISPPGGERQVKSCCKKVPVIYKHTVPAFCFSEKMTYLTLTLVSDNTQKRKRHLTSDSDLTKDYPKENDSSSNNKTMSDPSRKFLLSCKDKLKQVEENRCSVLLVPAPLQPTSFYGSRSVTKDYSTSHSFLDRPSSTSQTTSAKRSLMLPNHSTPFKKVRPMLDYGGWNKPRPSTLAQPQPPLQGFSNLGNTCYMNAILQSLFSLPSFSNDLLKQGIPWKKVPANALLRRFAHLLAKKDISCPEVKKDLLRRVKSSISSTAERFSGYMQNDAHEFLSQCLDQLKEDMEKVNKSWKSDSAAWDEADTSHTYTCPVVVNMEFEVQHTITCKGCGEVVTKREQFNDLSIDLPRRKKTIPLRSIQDSLDLFFRMEEIEYSCEKCSRKAATVTHKFSRLPRVLILHLKRYSFNAQLSLNSKLGQQVMIPRYLTLLSHCTDTTQPPLSLGWSVRCVMVGSGCCVSVQRGVQHTDASDINDEAMLAVVLEMSCQDTGLSCPAPEDEPTSSPDTGFGDTDPDTQESNYHPDLLETDNKPSAGNHDTHTPQPGETGKYVLDSLDLTMDENKENQTPEGVQGELDWVQQYSLEQEREEQELQQALAQSLQEHEAQEMREDDDLKRATELSLQEFNNSLPELLCSDEDSGNEEVLDMEYSEAEAGDLKRNAESGDLANSFRLISVVSHIGSSSSSGHYISDIYDMKKQSWLTYNDLDVSRTQEATVQRDRDRSGYIFFYMHKDVFEELSELERTGASGGASEAGRTVLQPL
uniref:Ubiquitin carboxyl-terminal hydrolase n=1 Tax=Salmo trutta TaxID=8032 RepID=A0A673YSQ3_SALTR